MYERPVQGSLHYVIAWSVGEACVRSTPWAHHPDGVAALTTLWPK
jgi:hypothetical protein